MSLLAALVNAHNRLPDKAPFGYAEQAVQFVLEIDDAGNPVVGLYPFGYEKKRLVDRVEVVPYFGGRSGSDAPPYFLWDNSAYVLGVTAKEGFDAIKRHQAFKNLHRDALANTGDPALLALRNFLDLWSPDMFEALDFPVDAKDRNIVFRHVGRFEFIHQRDEAALAWKAIYKPDTIGQGVCLVTGDLTQIARLHPPIKTFENPARIVSFDKDNDAFSSYGHTQAENAPTGIEAAFQYSAILNRFLQRDSGHRIQIGDASTVFWADASEAAAQEAEGLFGAFFDPDAEEILATSSIAARLEDIRNGKRLADIAPNLNAGVRFYVLGLAPNAARLSVRFYWESDFGQLTANFQRYLSDTAIDPPPRDGWPPLWRYLRELAVLGKSENVPPNLAGDWMRAILTGTPYPMTLLSTALMRMRSDGEINALRVAIVKSVLIRNFNSKEASVALNPTSQDTGYVLGRLFAAYENIQRAALGRNVNATIRDKFYGSAAATPSRVYGSLASNSFNHLAKIRKEKPAFASYLQSELQGIADLLEVSENPFPASLSQESQAKFALGYYHQASFRKPNEGQAEEYIQESAQ